MFAPLLLPVCADFLRDVLRSTNCYADRGPDRAPHRDSDGGPNRDPHRIADPSTDSHPDTGADGQPLPRCGLYAANMPDHASV